MAELVDAHVSGACAARRAGSSPVLGTTPFVKRVVINAEIAQLVEHNLAKVGVASSSLVFRSIHDCIIRLYIKVGFFCFKVFFSCAFEAQLVFLGI